MEDTVDSCAAGMQPLGSCSSSLESFQCNSENDALPSHKENQFLVTNDNLLRFLQKVGAKACHADNDAIYTGLEINDQIRKYSTKHDLLEVVGKNVMLRCEGNDLEGIFNTPEFDIRLLPPLLGSCMQFYQPCTGSMHRREPAVLNSQSCDPAQSSAAVTDTPTLYTITADLQEMLSTVDARGKNTHDGQLFTLKQLVFFIKEYIDLHDLTEAADNPLQIQCPAGSAIRSVLGVESFSFFDLPDLLKKRCITAYKPPPNRRTPRKQRVSTSSNRTPVKDESSPNRTACISAIPLPGFTHRTVEGRSGGVVPLTRTSSVDAVFRGEYDVASSYTESPDKHVDTSPDTDTTSSEQDILIVYKESDVEFWADSESSDDSDISESDRWICKLCDTTNSPKRGICDLCQAKRPGWWNHSKVTQITPRDQSASPKHPTRNNALGLQSQSSNDRQLQRANRCSVSTDTEQTYSNLGGTLRNRMRRGRRRVRNQNSSNQHQTQASTSNAAGGGCGTRLSTPTSDTSLHVLNISNESFQFDISEGLRNYIPENMVIHPPDRVICHTATAYTGEVRRESRSNSDVCHQGSISDSSDRVSVHSDDTLILSDDSAKAEALIKEFSTSYSNDYSLKINCSDRDDGKRYDRSYNEQITCDTGKDNDTDSSPVKPINESLRSDSGIDITDSQPSCSANVTVGDNQRRSCKPNVHSSRSVTAHLSKETRITFFNYQVGPARTNSSPVTMYTPPKSDREHGVGVESLYFGSREKDEDSETEQVSRKRIKNDDIKSLGRSASPQTHDKTAVPEVESAAKQAHQGQTTPQKHTAGLLSNPHQDSCVLCLNAPKEASLIHGNTGHQICCYSCAKKLRRRGRPCPVCRKKIKKVIRNFVV